MALGSPGVEVTVIDESFYSPNQPNTIPFIFVATAQDKTNPSGSTAPGTTTANNGKVWLVTSQRDLTDTFGTPFFEKDSNGSSINGSELNEYGLQAAYSTLGVTSRAYIARADVNLGQIAPSSSAPDGDPVGGTYWVDTDDSLFGVFEWDASANSGKGAFTQKTPKIIDDTNYSTAASGALVPLTSFGSKGDYAMVVTSDNENKLYFKDSSNAWISVQNGFNTATTATVVVAPHTSYPDFTTATGSSAVTGSVWIKTTSPGKGANWSIKTYNGSTKTWGTVPASIYESSLAAIYKMDSTGGGVNIPVGTLFVESSYDHQNDVQATFKIWRRNSASATRVVSEASTASPVGSWTFDIRETESGSNSWSSVYTITVNNTTTSAASQIPAAISAAGLTHVSATYDAATKKVTFIHDAGGDFELLDGTGSPLSVIGLTAFNVATQTGTVNLYTAPLNDGYDFIASNWKPLSYEARPDAPVTNPANGTLWFDSNLGEVDIMIHDGTTWVGYKSSTSPYYSNGTDSMGPIISATEPTTQQDGSSALVEGDIWVSTADIDRYGMDVYVHDGISWVLQDVTDNNSPNGWVFANARSGTSGGTSTSAPEGSIVDLLTSNFLDFDAPDPDLYPKGTKLWNLRRSGYTVKKYVTNYVDLTETNDRMGSVSMSAYNPDRWTCVTPNNLDGSGAFGRFAQRSLVVSSLKSYINTNTTVRDTDTLVFNLIACPGYPEVVADMVAFNNDRGQTAFVIGDTPMRLAPTASALKDWGTNANNATDNGEDGAVTRNEYLALFYPSGLTTDNRGDNVVVPPSHMMLRTIITSDAKSYQWFAPAGLRRGVIDNASSVGYLDSNGDYQTVALYEGLRNVMQDPITRVAINPISTLPGIGLVNFGQQTRANAASALDRINVARLVAYLRRQLAVLAKPFLFEPNDEQTRREIKGAAESLLIELVGQRALYDFIVVCDSTNNTRERIDRSELHMDIAIEPVKAVEFIYIPLRIKNTGEIAAGV